ncbi:F-box only protein 47-like [Haliotis cracherodii]|uniref:F-box only protein 47-like n=1 Tax=Haliotis cracherodii TaxID=6455 RepID=UPI0039EB45FC
MDIKTYMSCKKPRRSIRLEGKVQEHMKETAIKQSPLGIFDILPLELKFYILKFCSVIDLSLMTITSKAMRNLIEGYRVTRPLSRHFLELPDPHVILPLDEQAEYFKKYQRLGLLMKRSSCLYATKERLKFVNDFLTRMMCSNSKYCTEAVSCVALCSFGHFFHTVIAGWDDSECQKAYDVVCQHSCILKTLKYVVTGNPGYSMDQEMKCRVFLRRVFLDACPTSQDKAFWLSRILKPWPMVHQAKILYLLYGAETDGELLWYDMCESTPSTSEESARQFGEIANIIQILYLQSKEWSEDDIISVLDELTSYPDEWLAENVAHLLLMCGDQITSKLLISKAINGRIIELCSITTSFCLVCVKNNFSLSYVITMLQNIIKVMDSPKDRMTFINSMMDMFKELILDMHEYTESGDGHDGELYYLVMALSEFTKRVVHIAFKSLLG